jgi:2-polyprenyl-3-methyl-5-hydroxy-6-metoxy-1,4-benzoquinol methylase
MKTLPLVETVSLSEDVVGVVELNGTREEQYNFLRKYERVELGLMLNQAWHDDPKRLLFVLSRYKFVSKILSGVRNTLEVGCGDAFATRLVQQTVPNVTVLDFDKIFIEDIKQRQSEDWPLTFLHHDILEGPPVGRYKSVYSLDVLEHITPEKENIFLTNICSVLESAGILIIGMPSLESQPYASPASKTGHVNCKSAPELRQKLEEFFDNVMIFSMNDEVVHTGFYPMANYLFAVCTAMKNEL